MRTSDRVVRPGRRGIALAAVLGLLLTGCGVPGTGPTTRVEQVPDDAAGEPLDAGDPLLPTSNAQETVKNFLGAAAGDWSGRDDRLNQFVSGDGNWSEPEVGDKLLRIADESIDVADGPNLTTAKVTVSGTIVGTYLSDGQVQPPTDDTDFDATFELERELAFESWQLTDPPEQVYMLDTTFAKRYETRSLYFPAKGDATGTLVPDLRWIPTNVSSGQERYFQLAEWLLNGPSEEIIDSVDSSFPRGTTRSSVTVHNTKVTVDISSEAASQELGDPADMSAQLAWSLGLSDNQQLSLLVDGQERQTAPVSQWDDRSRAPAENSTASSLIYFLNDGAVRSDDPGAPFVGSDSLGLVSAALEPQGDRMVGVVDGGLEQHLIVGPEDALERVGKFSAEQITDPQWFSKDRLMVLADGKPRMVKLGDGPSKTVGMDDVDGDITSIALSPDSRRLAYVADGRAYVVPVIEADGLTVSLGEPRLVGTGVTRVRDIGWSQETRLLLIGAVSDSDDWLWEISIDNAYQQSLEGAEDNGIADSLAVRCAPPKNNDEVGQPTVVVTEDVIFRVFSTSMDAVQLDGDDDEQDSAVGYAPFTKP